MNLIGKLAAASALVLFAAAASAADTGTMSQMSGGMHNMAGSNGSMHKMPATVKSVDAKTGVVVATTEGMDLTLHFPPASVASLKEGDKITLHMGYTKP